MSELRAFDITLAEEGYSMGVVKYRKACYDKAEVDKYIAEQKDEMSHEVDLRDKRIAALEAENAELKSAKGRLECELDLWRDGNIIREETLNEINTLHRTLCRLRIGFALHFGRVNSGKMIVAYWRKQAEQYKEGGK